MKETPRVVKIPGQRRARFANWLLDHHPLHRHETISIRASTSSRHDGIKVVCISDTHNTQPDLPSGDILIHAGDLTENGSFDEFQAQLSWLSDQPFQHKILIAGNHDVILDEKFLQAHPERRYEQLKSAADLNWGTVTYLQDSTVTLACDQPTEDQTAPVKAREIRIFGSPWTPRYGISAFQYPREEDIWSDKIPNNTDIVVTHGPPRLYIDTAGIHRAGCVFLSQEIHRTRPKLAVFGHIHAAYGRQDIILDQSRKHYDDIINHWRGLLELMLLAVEVVMVNLRVLVFGLKNMITSERSTVFVNASVVGGKDNELKNNPIVVVI
jgi:predicted phosphohydrolase